MKSKPFWWLLLLSGQCLVTASAFAQGSLTPPGSPAPTMRSLDQIYSQVAKLTPADPLVLVPMLSSNQQGVIHLNIKGVKQGDIRGECNLKGLENSIVCLGFSHSVVSPRDAASGLPTGKRQHAPLRIVKRIDRATPMLYTALAVNENLATVTLKFFQTDARGVLINHYKITLTNASISRITSEDPNTEILEFVYQKIEWLHVPSGASAMDDWETPNI